MPRTERIDVQGMSCANCSATIEDTLADLDGVTEANANFATDEASVTYDPEAVSLESIYDAVADAGYDPVDETVTVTITDMSCANCSQTVHDALLGMPGVITADVNFATDEARVRYNPATASTADLYDAIADAGYSPVRETESTGDADGQGESESGESAADAARRAETRKQRNLTLFGAAFAVPLFALMLEGLFAPDLLPETLPGTGLPFEVVGFVLATPVQYVLGKEFYANSYTALVKNGRANMDVLIALGSSTAYVYSVATLAGLVAGGSYFDSAAFILTFITLGNYLEARSKSRAGEAIRSLLEMEADTARVLEDGEEREVEISAVKVGDHLVVKPGEKVPTDGVVVEGESAIDESMVTGESEPVGKTPGDDVVGGTVNENGRLVVEATKVGSETALQQIVETVREAQSRQPEVQNLADRISAYFVPAVIANALLWGVLWYAAPGTLAGVVEWLPLWGLVGGGPVVAGGTVSVFEFAVVVFASAVLVACPCALGLATPAATMIGTSIGATNGVLFTGGDVLERVRDVDTVVFDKTGTLTKGEMTLTDVVALDRTAADGGDARADGVGSGPVAAAEGGENATPTDPETDLLYAAASAESASEHPLADAIVAGATERGIDYATPTDFENTAGKGVRATVDGREVLVGNAALLSDAGVPVDAAAEARERLESEGKTAMLVAVDGRLAGVVAAADTVKPTAKRAVSDLQARGKTVRLLTGDNERTARAVADELGIPAEHVRAEVLPDEKADAVGAIQSDGSRAMMVGDGVNDAPALAAAYVGAAIGSGTDVAIEAADVTLMRDDPADVLKAINVSDATLRKIKQNLFWALGYNTVLIPLASLGLMMPALAAAAMAFSSVSVLSNSLLFRKYDPSEEYSVL
ncbi:Cu+-exporting ATPase [Halarchaeum rubridurum]|uniref:Cu+-exporting ATPase n=1 Tax=Halarchaeum rubridurum TaxID=489911 RepID=A0A830FU98_9EURY|nr:heavy metal translocating P-type ATPase [Halarchaeum rubridurum]MBP1954579.1 Cu+-exporting ATPase [Halarchaeum rubridurum]GGM62189.1 heavy metal translocating P-type ATPase [Halarchaeum rubridurum]